MEPSPHKRNSSSINSDEDEEDRSSSSTMVLVRRVLPKEEEDGNSPPLLSLPTRGNKRRCVSSACIPCRKRKSKVCGPLDSAKKFNTNPPIPDLFYPSPSLSWSTVYNSFFLFVREQCDGISPACSTCVAVYRTNCAYDFDGDHRRKGALKRHIEQLKDKHDSLDAIVATIRSAPDSEVGEIVNHIRKYGSLADIATSIKSGPLASSSLAQSLETDLSDTVDKFRVSCGGELRCLGYRPSWSDESSSLRENRSSSGSWTKVTPDINLISDLLVSHRGGAY